MSESSRPGRYRFRLQALLYVVALVAVALVAFQYGYMVARTQVILELVNEGWTPPRPGAKQVK